MVNKKNRILCTAATIILQCTLIFIPSGATGISAREPQQFGPWYSDAATGLKAPGRQTTSQTMHPLELPIVFFQQIISPQDGPVCRFHPTCSAYGRTAVSRFGALKGLLLTADRLVRDNPYNPVSRDPVPYK